MIQPTKRVVNTLDKGVSTHGGEVHFAIALQRQFPLAVVVAGDQRLGADGAGVIDVRFTAASFERAMQGGGIEHVARQVFQARGGLAEVAPVAFEGVLEAAQVNLAGAVGAHVPGGVPPTASVGDAEGEEDQRDAEYPEQPASAPHQSPG